MGYVWFHPPSVFSSIEHYCTAKVANRRKLLGFFFFSMEGQDLWALLSSMTATEEEYRQKGGGKNPDQTFLVFRRIPARTGAKCVRPEEQWLHHDAQRLNFRVGLQWVGRCQRERDQEGRLHLQSALERLQPSALRQHSKASKSQALASPAAAQAGGLYIPVRLIFELHYLPIRQQQKKHY